MVPEEHRSLLDPCNTIVSGIGGNEKPVGQFCCNLYMGQGYFKNVLFYVMKNLWTPLVGANVILHKSITRKVWDSDCITFIRNVNGYTFEHTTPITETGGAFHQCERPTPEASLDEKIKWLLQERQLTIPADHADKNELDMLVNLLLEYEEVFGTSLGEFPDHVSIPTNGESKYAKQYRIPAEQHNDFHAELVKMVKQGVIERCDNPRGFNTPLMGVYKKNGKLRIVANFKNTVNRVLSSTADMCWQMPGTDVTIEAIGGGNTYFSSLDLKAGYWQCTIKDEDRHKTAFQWEDKVYQFKRLPFGMKCSGQIFSRCIARALEGVMLKSNMQVYIDDVLCYAKDFNTYISVLTQVLSAAKSNNLRLNAEKCTFLERSAKFLGRVITENGYEADNDHVEAILKMPSPTTRKELRAVIGRITWLRMFVETRIGERVRTHCFAHLLKEMSKLNRTGDFVWSEAAEKAFNVVKERLASPPVIHFPDVSKTFFLVTDASDTACGAVLMQEHNGHQVPVAVASHTLKSAEQNWSASERECYAILWAVEKFTYFLRYKTFIVLTDHKALTYLDKTEFKNPKIQRWQDRLSEYSFVIQYIEGENNVFADMMSRPCGGGKQARKVNPKVAGKILKIDDSPLRVYIPSWCLQNIKSVLPTVTLVDSVEKVHLVRCFAAASAVESDRFSSIEDIVTWQRSDPFLGSVMDCIKRGRGLEFDMDPKDHRGILYKRYSKSFKLDPITMALVKVENDGKRRIVVPPKLLAHMLNRAHDHSGHFGRVRTAERLDDFWWPLMRDDITNYCNSCVHCTRVKGNYGRSGKVDIGHLRRGKKPFEVLFVDFVHMKNARGKRYILTVLDSFSRYFFAIPCSRDRAIDAASALVREVILKFNCIPKIISSDRGTHFSGKIFEEMCSELGIKQELHTAWHPESSGNIERSHRTLKNSLYALCADRGWDWVKALPYCVNAMNLAKNAATGCAPATCVFGRKAEFGLPTLNDDGVSTETAASYGANVRKKLTRTHYLVQLSAEEADKEMERRLNKGKPPERLEIGDEVYIKREHSAIAKSTNLPWIGTYRILDTNQRVIKVCDEKNNVDWIHRNHVLKRVERKAELNLTNQLILDFPPPTPLDSPKLAPAHVDTSSNTGLSNSESGGQSNQPPVTEPTTSNQQVQALSMLPRRWSSRSRKEPNRFSYDTMPITPRKARKK